MITSRRKTGNLGEDIALKFLQGKGFRLIDRNFNKPWGEIDIILEKDDTVRFIEVKSVSREINGNDTREIDYRPEELIDRRKLKKLARTAALYMESRRDTREYQIDAIGVILDKKKRVARCRFFEQALEDNL